MLKNVMVAQIKKFKKQSPFIFELLLGGPSSPTTMWVGRVLPEAKFENKWTMFFEFFDLSDLYIFGHLSLHIHFRAFKPSHTFSSI